MMVVSRAAGAAREPRAMGRRSRLVPSSTENRLIPARHFILIAVRSDRFRCGLIPSVEG